MHVARILVVYATIEGHTARIAERVAARLREAGHEGDFFRGYGKHGPLKRLVMLVRRWRAGVPILSRDYEYTDWAAVDRFSESFARQSFADRRDSRALSSPAA